MHNKTCSLNLARFASEKIYFYLITHILVAFLFMLFHSNVIFTTVNNDMKILGCGVADSIYFRHLALHYVWMVNCFILCFINVSGFEVCF